MKTHKTAVVIIPPYEVWPAIQTIRKAQDRNYRRWMPHITLLYPFREYGTFSQVAATMREVCQSTHPFELRLATLKMFEHLGQNYTLWLNPEPRNVIGALQEALWEVVPDCDDTRRHKGGFTPHLSVGQQHGEQQAKRLLTELQQLWQPLIFQVATISLIWRNDPPDDVFRVGEELVLGANGRDVATQT
ncbi:MAG: 2'-5' RNA ligase family protein [Chloroflexota bacterium]